MARIADQANAQYQPDRPQAIAPLLADGLRATRALTERVRASSLPDPGKADVLFELGAKENQFEHALSDSLGLSLFAEAGPDKEPQRQGPFGLVRSVVHHRDTRPDVRRARGPAESEPGERECREHRTGRIGRKSLADCEQGSSSRKRWPHARWASFASR